MPERRRKALLVSDFNARNLAGYLANDVSEPVMDVETAPFGQVESLLRDPAHAAWQGRPDVAIVWTRPQAVIPLFGEMIDGHPAATDDLLREVDHFCASLGALESRVKYAFVPLWSVAPEYTSAALLDLHPSAGISRALAAMNSRLIEGIERFPNVFPMDTTRWLLNAGATAFNPKLWYMAKVPFSNEVFLGAVAEIKSSLNGLDGRSRKLILVDLDDTLWGGIVGDVGWENLRLGGHDPLGEAYVDFQKALRTLRRRGILLAIVSKNDEAVALEAIRNHPEMVLRETDFCGWRINWGDKAQNIVDLASELNLGLQSIVFLDDNRFERARVSEALSEVLVPELPADPMLYRKSLMDLPCFNVPAVSQEDLERTSAYRAERQRSDLRARSTTLDEWLQTLGTRLQAETLNPANSMRATQLLNKTNQLNLSTRRLSEAEFQAWAASSGNWVWSFRVSDKFGDSGLTGLASLTVDRDVGRLVDFVLSCRVMGRKIEESMLAVVLSHARRLGLRRVVAEYLPTPKNEPCLRFLEHSGGRATKPQRLFEWDLLEPNPLPDCIALEQA